MEADLHHPPVLDQYRAPRPRPKAPPCVASPRRRPQRRTRRTCSRGTPGPRAAPRCTGRFGFRTVRAPSVTSASAVRALVRSTPYATLPHAELPAQGRRARKQERPRRHGGGASRYFVSADPVQEGRALDELDAFEDVPALRILGRKVTGVGRGDETGRRAGPLARGENRRRRPDAEILIRGRPRMTMTRQRLHQHAHHVFRSATQDVERRRVGDALVHPSNEQ